MPRLLWRCSICWAACRPSRPPPLPPPLCRRVHPKASHRLPCPPRPLWPCRVWGVRPPWVWRPPPKPRPFPLWMATRRPCRCVRTHQMALPLVEPPLRMWGMWHPLSPWPPPIRPRALWCLPRLRRNPSAARCQPDRARPWRRQPPPRPRRPSNLQRLWGPAGFPRWVPPRRRLPPLRPLPLPFRRAPIGLCRSFRPHHRQNRPPPLLPPMPWVPRRPSRPRRQETRTARPRSQPHPWRNRHQTYRPKPPFLDPSRPLGPWIPRLSRAWAGRERVPRPAQRPSPPLAKLWRPSPALERPLPPRVGPPAKACARWPRSLRATRIASISPRLCRRRRRCPRPRRRAYRPLRPLHLYHAPLPHRLRRSSAPRRLPCPLPRGRLWCLHRGLRPRLLPKPPVPCPRLRCQPGPKHLWRVLRQPRACWTTRHGTARARAPQEGLRRGSPLSRPPRWRLAKRPGRRLLPPVPRPCHPLRLPVPRPTPPPACSLGGPRSARPTRPNPSVPVGPSPWRPSPWAPKKRTWSISSPAKTTGGTTRSDAAFCRGAHGAWRARGAGHDVPPCHPAIAKGYP